MPARAERRGRRGAPDIQAELKTGDAILLECKWDDAAGLLENQLTERLAAYPDTLAVAGVLYPARLKLADDIQAALAAAEDLQWWVHGTRGAAYPELNIRNGAASDLADQLRALPLELEGVDRVVAAAGIVGYGVERAAQSIAAQVRIAQRIADIIAETDRENDRSAALRIACLVLFNALAFQDRLSDVSIAVPTVGEARPDRTKHGSLILARLRAAWSGICEGIDYVPVFRLAIDILDELSDALPEVQDAVIAPLYDAMRRTRQLEGHDLSGRLFHTLLSDAKFTGAYYTSVPAATMLARLVFHNWPPGVNWQDHEFPASLNVADLACGTGTLLMAVAAEAERRHVAAGGRRAALLHKAMAEQALHGYDVQLSAIHFAATSLAMLNPEIQFDRMNLYVMPLGAEGDNVALGSLDFMGQDEVAVQFALSPDDTGVNMLEAERVGGSGSRGIAEGQTARLPNLDLAIMNPPFTRSVIGNRLFGNVADAAERRGMQDELAQRLRSRQAQATAGLGAAFVATAAPKLRPGEGRLALVLPLTLCTGPSWQQTRSLIERQFALDMVIASHDPLRYNFSDSTDLSEVLLIATRRPASGGDVEHRTTFVNLWQNPAGVLDAHRMAQAVTHTTPANVEDTGTALLSIDGRHVGEVVSIAESRLAGGQWFGVQFARADMARSALRLLDNGEVWIPGESAIAALPLCRLDEIGAIGPDIRDVRDAFEITSSVTPYPMVANHNTELRKSIATEPDMYLAPLTEPRRGRRLKPIDLVWPKSGRLMIGARFRLNTVRVVAMRSNLNALASMWWPVRFPDESFEKAMAVWFNSSIGLLTLLATRNTTMGAWVQLKKADLERLPVLDLRALSEAQLRAMAALFDELRDEEFERLPAMADCPARRRLDEGLAAILSLPDLSGLRRLLATEPVVSNRRL